MEMYIYIYGLYTIDRIKKSIFSVLYSIYDFITCFIMYYTLIIPI